MEDPSSSSSRSADRCVRRILGELESNSAGRARQLGHKLSATTCLREHSQSACRRVSSGMLRIEGTGLRPPYAQEHQIRRPSQIDRVTTDPAGERRNNRYCLAEPNSALAQIHLNRTL